MAGHEREVVVGHRDRAVLERAAVEQQRPPGLAEDRRELVHDPVVEPDVPVLAALDEVFAETLTSTLTVPVAVPPWPSEIV